MKNKKFSANASNASSFIRGAGYVALLAGVAFDRTSVVIAGATLVGASYAREYIDCARGYFSERLEIERLKIERLKIENIRSKGLDDEVD